MADNLTNKTFQFELVSPEHVVASEEVAMVVVPGETGDFGVLADHAPQLSSIRPGVVSMYLPSGDIRKIFVAGGFADVGGAQCSVLVEEAVNINDIDRPALEQSLKALGDELATTEDGIKRAKLLRDKAVTEAKLAAA